MTYVGRNRLFYDEELNLIYKEEPILKLIPHAEYPGMWHIWFSWSKNTCPEFFNGTNAKENGFLIAMRHLNNGIEEPE